MDTRTARYAEACGEPDAAPSGVGYSNGRKWSMTPASRGTGRWTGEVAGAHPGPNRAGAGSRARLRDVFHRPPPNRGGPSCCLGRIGEGVVSRRSDRSAVPMVFVYVRVICPSYMPELPFTEGHLSSRAGAEEEVVENSTTSLSRDRSRPVARTNRLPGGPPNEADSRAKGFCDPTSPSKAAARGQRRSSWIPA